MGTTFVFTIRRALAGVDHSSSGSYQSVLKVRDFRRTSLLTPYTQLNPPRRLSQKHDPYPHVRRRRSRGDPSPPPLLPQLSTPYPLPLQRSHFGKPAQAHSDEALAWLKEHILGRRLKCQLIQRDQYGRIVALPLLPHHRWWPRRSATRNLPLEMVRAGWGVVYTAAGAQYGGWGQPAFLEAQAEAQYVFFYVLLSRARYLTDESRAARRGMWHAGTNIETPAEYKKRHRALQEATGEEEPEAELEVVEPERRGILDRIFRRGK